MVIRSPLTKSNTHLNRFYCSIKIATQLTIEKIVALQCDWRQNEVIIYAQMHESDDDHD